MLKWLKAWRLHRLERYLAELQARLAEWRAMERATGYVWPHATTDLAGEIARLKRKVEQLKEAKNDARPTDH